MPKLKTNKLRLPLLLLILLGISAAKAQTFGGNPPSIKWQQINTPAARIIFPKGMDSVASRVAGVISGINDAVKPTLGNKQRQVNVVLQNQTTETNGYVGLAPFRSEFYLTPQQNSFELGGLPWAEMLSVHEFRHVQQYNNFNVGLSKTLRILFGEGGQAVGNSLSVPDWFYEGDAVYNETLVSKQGRGRLPFFYNDFRGLWAAGKKYSWMKLRNGSYVDYVPTHYPLGYMMVAYGRETYGDDFWRKVTQDAAAYKYGSYPFQKAIKVYSGKDYKTFIYSALSYFKQQFNDKPPALSAKHFIADEEFPAYADDSTLIYLRSSYDRIPTFIIRSGEQEKRITNRGLANDRYFAYHDGKIVYSGYRPDVRWGYRNYNEVRVIDINTGKERRITNRSKYFSPAFSNDTKRIVVVEASSGKSALHVLDADNGKLLTAIPNPDNLFYTYPKFYDDKTIIAAVRDKTGKMAITQVDVKTGTHSYILPPDFRPIGYLAVQHDTVYFTATSGKNDKLYALSVTDKKLFELKNDALQSSIGNYQPAISANKLAWVGFTAYGYQIQQADKKAVQWVEVAVMKPEGLSVFNVASLNQNSASGLLSTVSDSTFKISKYSKGHNLFNFHSLIPDFSDPNYRVALTGENVLNTFQSELFFNYNRNEQYKQVGLNAMYGALFPYLRGGADYIFDRRTFNEGSNIYFNQFNLHGGIQVPLNFSRGKHITGLNFGSDIYYTREIYRQIFDQFNQNYTYLNNFITFSTRAQQARQNINPRLGQTLALVYKSALGIKGTQYLASGTFYFPGLKPNHSLVINLAHQQSGRDNQVLFSNNFPFSQGYTANNYDNMNKAGATYHFPLAYPDAGLGNIAYLLRLRGNVFYEFTQALHLFNNGSKLKANFRSAGAALFFDTRFFNQQALSFGIRYSRLLDDDIFGSPGRNRIEIVLPVSFF